MPVNSAVLTLNRNSTHFSSFTQVIDNTSLKMREFLMFLLLISTPENIENTGTLNKINSNSSCINCHNNNCICIAIVPESCIPNDEAEYEEQSKVFECERWKGMKLAYVLLDYEVKKTLVICSEEKMMIGRYCPEWNNRTLQVRYSASCANFNPPCPFKYNIWDSYKYRGCFDNEGEQNHRISHESHSCPKNFEKKGNHSRPESGDGKENHTCPETTGKENTHCVLTVPFTLSLLGNFATIVYIVTCLLGKKCCGKKNNSADSLMECVTVMFNKTEGDGENQNTENNGMRVSSIGNKENGDGREVQEDRNHFPVQVTNDDDETDGEKEETEEDDQSEVPEEHGEDEPFLQETYHESEIDEQESDDDYIELEVH